MRLFVKSTGDDTNSGKTISQPLATIQQAISLANDGDEIFVLDNITTSSDVILPSKSIHIRGVPFGYYPLTDGEARPSRITFDSTNVLVLPKNPYPLIVQDIDFVFNNGPAASGADVVADSNANFCYHKNFINCMFASHRDNPVVNLSLNMIGLVNFYNVHIQSYNEYELLVLNNVTGLFDNGMLTQHTSGTGAQNPHVLVKMSGGIPRSFVIRSSTLLFTVSGTGYDDYLYVSDAGVGTEPLITFDRNAYFIANMADLSQSKFFTKKVPTGAIKKDERPSKGLFESGAIPVYPVPGIYAG